MLLFPPLPFQFLRGRQFTPAFMWNSSGVLKPLSFADILVASAAVSVNQCSGRAIVAHSVGRPEATVADEGMLPSPTSIIEDKHFSVFQAMVSALCNNML